MDIRLRPNRGDAGCECKCEERDGKPAGYFRQQESCGFSVAFLALAFTSGVSAVRAQTDVPSWMMVDPISTAVKALEERLASLEAKVASLAESPASRQKHRALRRRRAGARTCISKAQLDRLLKMMQTAAIEPPAKVNDRMTSSVAESVIESVTEPAKVESTVESAEAMPTAPAAEPRPLLWKRQRRSRPRPPPSSRRLARRASRAAEDKLEQDSRRPATIPAPVQGQKRRSPSRRWRSPPRRPSTDREHTHVASVESPASAGFFRFPTRRF